MSMAMRMMKKMGWQEGKGLGKNQDGIDAPLVGEERRKRHRQDCSNPKLSFLRKRTRSKTTNDPTNTDK